jgi:hypothetical protein
VLSSGVDDMLPVSQHSREIDSFTRLDQVVADACRQSVGDLLHQCVTRPVLELEKDSAILIEANTYRAMIGVRW